MAAGALLALLLVRRPEALFRPQFIWEEGAAFFAPTFVDSQVAVLLEPWNGFIYVIPRVAFALSRLLPNAAAPLMTMAVFALVLLAVAAFLGSERLRDALPDRRVRLVAAFAVVLLPFTSGEYASVLHVHWFLAIYLAALFVASEPTRVGRWVDRAAALVASLNGPMAILLAPLYVGAFRRRPDLALIVSAVGFLQVLTFGLSSRQPLEGASVVELAVSVLVRLGGTPLGSVLGRVVIVAAPLVFFVIALTTLSIAVACTRHLPVRTVLAFSWLSVGMALGLIAGGPTIDPAAEGRYFIAAAWFAMVLAAAAAINRSLAGLALATICAAGVVTSFRTDPMPDANWARNADCIGGPTPCVVGVHPPDWNVHWALPYRRPIGFDLQGGPRFHDSYASPPQSGQGRQVDRAAG